MPNWYEEEISVRAAPVSWTVWDNLKKHRASAFPGKGIIHGSL